MTTDALYTDIRTRLLDFVPSVGAAPLGATLRATIGERLFAIEAPDDASYPHAVFRLQSSSSGDGDDGRMQKQGEIELQVFGRPRASQRLCERIVDQCELAFLHWHANTDTGPLTLREQIVRDTLPPMPSPGDREVVQVRSVWRYTWWPSYLTPAAQP